MIRVYAFRRVPPAGNRYREEWDIPEENALEPGWSCVNVHGGDHALGSPLSESAYADCQSSVRASLTSGCSQGIDRTVNGSANGYGYGHGDGSLPMLAEHMSTPSDVLRCLSVID